MGMHNYMEDIVEKMVDRLISKREGVCKCEKCKLDIMAYVLNRLPSKYIVTQKGRVYAKLEELNYQLGADVAREVTVAIDRIKNNPRH